MTWSDKMSNSIGCIALDTSGVTIAIAHGENVSVANQTTICTRAFEIFQVLTKAVILAVWTNIRDLPDPPSFDKLK